MIHKLLRHAGIERIAIGDVSEYRKSFALKVGAEAVFDAANAEEREAVVKGIIPDGPELVVVATASTSALEDATRLTARGGRVLLFGAPKRGATVNIDLAHFFLNGTSIVTSYASSEIETREAMGLLSNGSITVSDLITHRFPLAATERAFAAAAEQQCMKALITD